MVDGLETKGEASSGIQDLFDHGQLGNWTLLVLTYSSKAIISTDNWFEKGLTVACDWETLFTDLILRKILKLH